MTVEFNTAEFDRALRLYAQASQRDYADIVNRTSLNLALRSVQFTEKANPKEIRALADEPWWPKYVAKRIGRSGAAQFKDQREREMAQKSREIIAARVRSRSFIASGWLPAARKLAARLGRALRSGAKQYGQDKGFGIPASGRGSIAAAIVANSAQGASKAGAKGFRQAMDFVARDMIQYAERKLSETARRHSAK